MEIMIKNISTIVMALSAIGTTVATIVLVIITKRYALLTQDILEATNKPKVIMFLHYSDCTAYGFLDHSLKEDCDIIQSH